MTWCHHLKWRGIDQGFCNKTWKFNLNIWLKTFEECWTNWCRQSYFFLDINFNRCYVVGYLRLGVATWADKYGRNPHVINAHRKPKGPKTTPSLINIHHFWWVSGMASPAQDSWGHCLPFFGTIHLDSPSAGDLNNIFVATTRSWINCNHDRDRRDVMSEWWWMSKGYCNYSKNKPFFSA